MAQQESQRITRVGIIFLWGPSMSTVKALATETEALMNKQLRHSLSCLFHYMAIIDTKTATKCESSERIDN